MLDELKENLKGEDWKQKYEDLGTKYNELVERAEKRKERNKELIKLLNIFEEELLKYKTESDYQEFLEKIELEYKIRLPKKQKEREVQKDKEQDKVQDKKKFSIEELRQRQRTIDERQQSQGQGREMSRNKPKGRSR